MAAAPRTPEPRPASPAGPGEATAPQPRGEWELDRNTEWDQDWPSDDDGDWSGCERDGEGGDE